MKKIMFSLLGLLILNGCGGEGAGIGFRESPAWHSTASNEVKRQHFAEECEQFGFEEGTDAMNSCIMKLWTSSKNKAKDKMSSSFDNNIICNTTGPAGFRTTTCY